MGQQIEANDALPSVVVAANSFWNITHFRASLVRALVAHGYRPILAAPNSDPRWANNVGAEIAEIPIDRSGINPVRDAQTLFAYWRLLRRMRPVAFLGFTVKPNVHGSLAAKLVGVPALANISGLGTSFMRHGPLSSFVTLLYRIALRGDQTVFFQNQDDRDLFLERGIISAAQARLLPGSGIDLERFSSAPEASGPPTFLLVGRLLGDKGVREFVDAARILSAKYPDWRFQLLGSIDEGNRSSVGQAELDSWTAEGVVEHLGETPDVRPHIGEATAIVLPSYREGLPRSLLEGAAMGKPLVASDVPGNRHLVEHGVNGLLCQVRNPASLADAMERLGLMPSEERAVMGAAGRARVEREFDERLVIGAYLDAIRQLRRDAKG